MALLAVANTAVRFVDADVAGFVIAAALVLTTAPRDVEFPWRAANGRVHSRHPLFARRWLRPWDLPMILHINGRFYGQLVTGVQRYGRELLVAMDRCAATGGLPPPFTRIVAHMPARAAGPVGLSTVEVRHHALGNGHAWEQLVLPHVTRDGLLFCPGNTAPIASLGRRPTVVTIHDLAYRSFPEAYSLPFRAWYQMITPLIMRCATRIITVSETERLAITRAYPRVADRVVAIQNGVTALPPAMTTPPPVPPPYLLYVGSLTRRKNVSGLLAAFYRLAARRPSLRLVIIGATSSVFARTEVPPDGPSGERVVLLGRVDDEALAAAYRGAAAFVFPSHYEASGLPPTEAMAYGCPVITSDRPFMRERCADAAIYCDPADPDAIASAVERVLDDPGLADELRRRGAARVAALTWEACADRTLSVLAAAACA